MVMSPRAAVRSPLMTVMTNAVQKAARGLNRDFGEVEHLQVSQKSIGDFVSVADTRAEKILHQELLKARPDYGFLMEESGSLPGKDPHQRWIIDPLDGTSNFLHGIPHFCITVALEKHGQIVAGVTYDPIKNELFWAEKGHGAFVNDRRLRVSSRAKMDHALLATGMPFGDHGDSNKFLDVLKTVMPKVAGIRRFGAAALDLAYVAAGRFEGFWENDLRPWDLAAGILLVKEAGGFVTEVNGGSDMLRTGSVLAANDHLHQHLLTLMRNPSA